MTVGLDSRTLTDCRVHALPQRSRDYSVPSHCCHMRTSGSSVGKSLNFKRRQNLDFLFEINVGNVGNSSSF